MKALYQVTVVMGNNRYGASVFQVASSEGEAIRLARMYGLRGKALVAEFVRDAD